MFVFPSITKKAFAWFSDLLVDHAELFWGMFAADMEAVLNEQPPDTWDSFPLFQTLNDYLRGDGECIWAFNKSAQRPRNMLNMLTLIAVHSVSQTI